MNSWYPVLPVRRIPEADMRNCRHVVAQFLVQAAFSIFLKQIEDATGLRTNANQPMQGAGS
jgi:hypothetical protein